ncbi:MAG: glycosyltransferase family 2 protein [Dehalococcoidia bacterium]|nr:glycosyltransferase family 2 protein [Chloroflexi bacterium CFX7]MCK6565384.1 glycosyltransferase family 2 protein [Dehalococcoidia bacterium]NUQ56289.1 glycosyltransferase family 2 protein [Dehalococcoidia bacterium]
MTSQPGGTGREAPLVAVLTVTTNAGSHLPAYLDALAAVTGPAWRLWLVDNASADDSAGIVERRLPDAVVLRNSANLGFTGACNRALKEILQGDARYVLFLNDDTEVTPGFLQALVALAGERTLVAPVTFLAGRPGHLDDAVGEFDWLRGTWKERVLGTAGGPEYRRAHEVDTANLSCLLVPVAAFHAAGLLDEAFFVYYDDTDFCRRVREAGFRILFQPEAVVYHRKGATLGGQLTPFGCYYLSRNRPYLIRKHLGLGPRFAVFFLYFTATRAARLALWAVHRRWDLCRATLAGMRDFMLGRMGDGGRTLGRP